MHLHHHLSRLVDGAACNHDVVWARSALYPMLSWVTDVCDAGSCYRKKHCHCSLGKFFVGCNLLNLVSKPSWWWQELSSQGGWEQVDGESSSASLQVSEMFMEMWCEILCFQHHPCGLRKLFLPSQGHCFSERRAKYMGGLCSQRWKKVTTSQKWTYLEACTVIVCIWIPHLFIIRGACESQTARNWFLLSSTSNLSN